MMDHERIQVVLAYVFTGLAVASLFWPFSTRYSGTAAGHLLGVFGMTVMLMTVIYPFRKRVQKKKGKQNPIDLHIYYGLIGPILVVLHSGHRFESAVGTLTYGTMVLLVFSGLGGRYLYRRVSRGLKDQKQDMIALKALLESRRHEVDKEVLARSLGLAQAKDAAEEFDETTRRKLEQMKDLARSIAETEQQAATFETTRKIFSRWLSAHIYLTIFLFVMVAVHILTTLYYGWKWLP